MRLAEKLESCAGGADRLVVVDTETTGLFNVDRVLEVSIVTLDLTGEIVEVYDTLVNPRRGVTATHIHGITAGMVENAPTFEEIAGDIALRLHGACFVAHNALFDVRMLSNEFARIGCDLVVPKFVDTYHESGFNLRESCAMWGVRLEGQHRARADAMATAELLLRLPPASAGAPTAAPIEVARTGRVMCRDENAPQQLVEPPLIVFLASRLPLQGLATRSRQYLDLVARAVEDLHLDRAERAELATYATAMEMSGAQAAQAHRRFVNELVDEVLADGIVTDDEYEAAVRIAAALDVDQGLVDARVGIHRTVHSSASLETGMKIAFTGERLDVTRESLFEKAIALGLYPSSSVSRLTSFVFAADLATQSGKATKAKSFGIPVLSIDDFLGAQIGDLLASSSTALPAAKVITCPSCLATWTVPATERDGSSQTCSGCTTVAEARPVVHRAPRREPRPVDAAVSWGPPIVELLQCRRCTTVWSREVSRGRKPHYCPSCAGRAVLPPPVNRSALPPNAGE